MSVAAKQNQKFPFHFLSAPPTPPAENSRKEGKFLVFAPATEGSGRGTESKRTIQSRATTRSARAKWVRAKVNMSAQIETSRSDRAAPLCGAAGAGGNNARRSATNWDGTGTEKRADLSLFRIQ